MSAPRGYATALLGILAATSLVAMLVNTTVNPWRVTPMPWSSKALECSRDITSQARTCKAGLIRSNAEIGVGIFGSSRVANGMDPEYKGWGRDDVYNFGCVGGFFYEAEALARYFLEHEPAQTVLFGIDPGDLSSDIDTRPLADFYGSPLAGGRGQFDRELRYLVGISTLEASVETLRRAARKNPPEYTPQGLHRRLEKRRKKSQRHYIRMHLAGEAAFDLPDPSRFGKNVGLNPDKAKRLESLMRECRRRNVRMVVFFHPQHALLNARASDAADTPVLFEYERRGILDLVARANAEDLPGPPVEFWDFYDSHPLNCDPVPDEHSRMPHWNDLGHYTIQMGNLLQARMMGLPLPPGLPGTENYGERVTPENLAAHLERIRTTYRRYLTQDGRKDVAWKEKIVEKTKETRDKKQDR
jgi:hypothetical protein